MPGFVPSADTTTLLSQFLSLLGTSSLQGFLADVRAGTLGSSAVIQTLTVQNGTATAVLLGDGAVGSPAQAFSLDPTSGRYRLGTNNLGEAINGVLVYDWNASRVKFAQRVQAPDGTSALPAYTFGSEATLGFWRSSAAVVTLQGSLTATASLTANGNVIAAGLVFNSFGVFSASADGMFLFQNNANTIGSRAKVDALPTVSSGFGSSPAVTAGSTPLAGSINVGTGGVATSGVINFNGTAFPSAPFVVATTSLTNAVIRATASTTQLTLTSTTAWTASDIISWVAISARA